MYFCPLPEIQPHLAALENNCLLALYLYLQLCAHLISTQTVPLAPFTNNVLFALLDKNPLLKSQHTPQSTRDLEEQLSKVKVSMFGKSQLS